MEAITLHQPWAQWVAEGLKTIETRTHARFAGLLGKHIAIHAAIHYDETAGKIAEPWLNEQGCVAMERARENHGVILCTAVVYKVGWLEPSHSVAAMIDCSGTKRFGLFLESIMKLPTPIPWRGQQGMFKVTC